MIRIHTLGGRAVLSAEGKTLAGAAGQPRRMAVLALLARAGERGIAREKVLAMLWPDADDERGPRALTQAFYALRKELGSEDAITGARELRLNPAYVGTDVAEFAAALVRGDNDRAAALYAGPFLDSFRLADADEFNRWVEVERVALARDRARALESLATTALAAGRAQDAVARWRELAALDPLNARVAVRLMEAMAAAGDRPGAIRHAHIYELLVAEELDLPPDREVTAFAARLREDAVAVGSAPLDVVPVERPVVQATPHPFVQAMPDPFVQATPDPSVQSGTVRPSPAPRWAIAAAAIGGIAVVGSALILSSRPRERLTETTGGVVAIGRIASRGSDSVAASLTSSVADLLATSLARLPDLRLVSQARMLELMRPGDSSGRAQLEVARRAGATEVIDGILYARGGGRLRLDLRLVDLSTGAIAAAAKSLALAVAVRQGEESQVSLVVESDAARVRQILANLVSNAVKYTEAAGHVFVAARVALAGEAPRRGRWVAVTVTDNGPGIPFEKQAMVFREFARFDPGAAAGSGIGLAISRRLARALGGDITFTSTPSVGSEFTLWLPFDPTRTPEGATREGRGEAPA